MNLLNVTELRVNGNRLTVPAGQAEVVLRHLGVNLNTVDIQFTEVNGVVTATVVPRESGTKGCTDCEDYNYEENEEDRESDEPVDLDTNLILSQKPVNFMMVNEILFPSNLTLKECDVMIREGFTGLSQEDFNNYTVADWFKLLDQYRYAKLARLLGNNHTPETVKEVVIELVSFLR